MNREQTLRAAGDPLQQKNIPLRPLQRGNCATANAWWDTGIISRTESSPSLVIRNRARHRNRVFQNTVRLFRHKMDSRVRENDGKTDTIGAHPPRRSREGDCRRIPLARHPERQRRISSRLRLTDQRSFADAQDDGDHRGKRFDSPFHKKREPLRMPPLRHSPSPSRKRGERGNPSSSFPLQPRPTIKSKFRLSTSSCIPSPFEDGSRGMFFLPTDSSLRSPD